jgi:acyl-CoA reductase-like NAD-dependent aldehyde dehydrogenase
MVLAANPLVRDYNLYIDGREVAPGGGRYEKLNPATEEVLGEAPDATVADVQRAIAAARRAFDEGPWPRMSGKERARYLTKIADLLTERKEDLVELILDETGCGRMMAETIQVGWPVQSLYGWADYAALPNVEALPPDPFGELNPTNRMAAPVNNRAILYEPVGVVGAITGYNFPFFLNIAKLGPALAAGDTIVLRPSPLTPFSALCIPKLIEDADLPPGVLNVVNGRDPETGRALTTSPLVDMIGFTGSAAVAKQIMADAAGTLKKLQLELGGKSALIVLDDADPAQVIGRAVGITCAHAGQGCAITSRVLVPHALYPAVAAGAAQAAAHLKIGGPREPDAMVTPLISAQQRERVEGFIRRGIEEGATLAYGGKRPAQPAKGFFLEPTVFTDVTNDMHIAREEIFGPVQTILPYDGGDEEAIRLANDSHYGLSGAVLTKDLARGLRVAKQIRTGSISVNGGGWLGIDVPFGGYKQSGLGREYGLQGFREYQETKAIAWG